MWKVVPTGRQPLVGTVLGTILCRGDRDVALPHVKLFCLASHTNKRKYFNLCVRLYVSNTKLTPSGSQMALFFIRSICQTRTFSVCNFTQPILNAKKAHFGLLSLGKAMANGEESRGERVFLRAPLCRTGTCLCA